MACRRYYEALCNPGTDHPEGCSRCAERQEPYWPRPDKKPVQEPEPRDEGQYLFALGLLTLALVMTLVMAMLLR